MPASSQPPTSPRPWRVIELGTLGYREVWQQQLALVAARQQVYDASAPGAQGEQGAPDEPGAQDEQDAPDAQDTLLLVQHPHVITLGRSQKAVDNVLTADDVEVVAVERGGDVTYHGPGQLVAYPIVLLREDERDLHRFLRNLEEAVIQTCLAFGLPADREPGKTGVWTSGVPGTAAAGPLRRKLCSMGIACRRWVTFHGLALNVNTDLSYFGRINPCGFRSEVMTSLQHELGSPVSLAEVSRELQKHLGHALGRTA